MSLSISLSTQTIQGGVGPNTFNQCGLAALTELPSCAALAGAIVVADAAGVGPQASRGLAAVAPSAPAFTMGAKPAEGVVEEESPGPGAGE